ncbi:predicted protein [Aspergillus nidulans FGSC A4]|uniref:Uncharacterized protein n=1 Tax=Emericella nidulans (strain FGSC A4 / ATCC 38163 / CBS 112.46 / NRRL 194 / M139) TaxID=227321 RepID=Q5AYX6_EMENI|nr:hypothetical protein [Aspergillus nidulans FGSC A4]EAA57844.1 predicted protein [Aspergillus nidulans FGSC A4]CBF70870.1 TPA: hypothetical protein ANIA_06504 [Aspergillus nidulans FGSC A4]|eukprot:XP_664108.1 predicted protein [Aspergillus nidulans FGSC A4]
MQFSKYIGSVFTYAGVRSGTMQPPQIITPNNRVLPAKDLRPQVILAYRQSPCIIGGRLHENLIHHDCVNPASARGKNERITLANDNTHIILPAVILTICYKLKNAQSKSQHS